MLSGSCVWQSADRYFLLVGWIIVIGGCLAPIKFQSCGLWLSSTSSPGGKGGNRTVTGKKGARWRGRRHNSQGGVYVHTRIHMFKTNANTTASKYTQPLMVLTSGGGLEDFAAFSPPWPVTSEFPVEHSEERHIFLTLITLSESTEAGGGGERGLHCSVVLRRSRSNSVEVRCPV